MPPRRRPGTSFPTGVRVVIQEHGSSEVLALQLWVKAGVRDEAESELRLAHYLEHLLFKGTGSRPRGFIERDVEGVGGLYGSHPLALPTLGRKAGVERLGREDLIRHHRRVYRAGSMVLAVSGGVERESLRRHVQGLFARTREGDFDDPPPRSQRHPRSGACSIGRLSKTRSLMGFLGPGIGDPDYAPGKIMSAVLGGSVAGRLFIELREEQGLAYSLRMVNPARRNPASFVAYIATSEHAVERAESGLRQKIERFRADGPSEAEVARAKAYALGNLAMDRRTNARHPWYLAFFELAGFGWDYPERYARALEAVRVPDVTRVARRYLANPARSW